MWSLCHKLKFSNTHIFATRWYKPLIFQALIIWSKIIYSLKYLRSTTLSCKDIGFEKYGKNWITLMVDYLTVKRLVARWFNKYEIVHAFLLFKLQNLHLSKTKFLFFSSHQILFFSLPFLLYLYLAKILFKSSPI